MGREETKTTTSNVRILGYPCQKGSSSPVQASRRQTDLPSVERVEVGFLHERREVSQATEACLFLGPLCDQPLLGFLHERREVSQATEACLFEALYATNHFPP